MRFHDSQVHARLNFWASANHTVLGASTGNAVPPTHPRSPPPNKAKRDTHGFSLPSDIFDNRPEPETASARGRRGVKKSPGRGLGGRGEEERNRHTRKREVGERQGARDGGGARSQSGGGAWAREAGDRLEGRGQGERGPLPPEYKMRGTGVGGPGLAGAGKRRETWWG